MATTEKIEGFHNLALSDLMMVRRDLAIWHIYRAGNPDEPLGVYTSLEDAVQALAGMALGEAAPEVLALFRAILDAFKPEPEVVVVEAPPRKTQHRRAPKEVWN